MKRYSKKEPLVFVYVMVPYIIIMIILIFGGCIFGSLALFMKSFGISAIYFFIIYALFGTVAIFIQKRFQEASDLFWRISIMLPVFYLMNIGAIYAVYFLYDHFELLSCKPKQEMLWWTILYGCIMSTVITFINEGLANWENWKNSLSESEKLKSAYQRSKLLGLKGQINPHFLFNCFNTLSGLIHENPQRAEAFLDEMTKVHRYLLRSDDDYLVSLQDEMKFAAAYLNLTKERFGDAINISMRLQPASLAKKLPPLSMQVILENIIYTNALDKKTPLAIRIETNNEDQLSISHSVHEKVIVKDQLNLDEGLDNLIMKYRLLDAKEVIVTETDNQRDIILPLFEKNVVPA